MGFFVMSLWTDQNLITIVIYFMITFKLFISHISKTFHSQVNTYDREKALFYLDPPYYEAERYYPDRFNPEDHERLKNRLDKLKGRFVLSYNDCEQIRESYKKYTIIVVDRVHNLGEGRYKEVII